MTTAAERAAFEHPSVTAEPEHLRRPRAALVEIEQRLASGKAKLAELRKEAAQTSYEAVLSRGQTPARRHVDRLMAEADAIRAENALLERA